MFVSRDAATISQTRQNLFANQLMAENINQDNQLLLKCLQCLKTFRNKTAFICHIKTHLGIKPYSCSECNKQFNKKNGLTAHQKIHSGIKPFSCPECRRPFRLKSHLKDHITHVHFSDREYDLKEVNAMLEKSSCANQALTDNTSQGDQLPNEQTQARLACDKCNKTFANQVTLNSHKRAHLRTKPYSCSKCSKQFKKTNHLINHLNRHSGIKRFSCPECSRRFSRKSHVKVHINCVHKNIKPFSCNVCNKKFGERRGLKSHLLVHSDIKHYGCHQCGKGFKGRDSLVKHIQKHSESSGQVITRKHTADTAFSSGISSVSLKISSSLKNHPEVELVTCKECKKSIKSIVGLKIHEQKIQHEKTHTAERETFTCNSCGLTCLRKKSLVRHVRRCALTLI